jgi:SAM-dependent methyltransferase
MRGGDVHDVRMGDATAISSGADDRIASLIVLPEWLLSPFRWRCGARRVVPDLRAGDRVVELAAAPVEIFRTCAKRRADGQGLRRRSVGRHVGESAGFAITTADNVHLIQADAAEFVPPEPLDGVLFGLSYNTMPHHRSVLQHAWRQLSPGGRIVIMDAKAPSGVGHTLALRFGIWLMKHTLLGNPLIQPWTHLAAMAETFSMQEYLLGSYYICRGSKPLAEGKAQLTATRALELA